MAIDIEGKETLLIMEGLCSDKERPDLFIPIFKNNYSQMKLDGRGECFSRFKEIYNEFSL